MTIKFLDSARPTSCCDMSTSRTQSPCNGNPFSLETFLECWWMQNMTWYCLNEKGTMGFLWDSHGKSEIPKIIISNITIRCIAYQLRLWIGFVYVFQTCISVIPYKSHKKGTFTPLKSSPSLLLSSFTSQKIICVFFFNFFEPQIDHFHSQIFRNKMD